MNTPEDPLARVANDLPDWRTMRSVARGDESLTPARMEERDADKAREDDRVKDVVLLDKEAQMALSFEFEQESDGRWIAEIPEVPGALAYGSTRDEAAAKAEAIALRVLATQIEADGKAQAFSVPAI